MDVAQARTPGTASAPCATCSACTRRGWCRSWVAPCGEYVHEIGADVDRFVRTELGRHPALRHAYARFVRDNPRSWPPRGIARDLPPPGTPVAAPGDPNRTYPQLAALDALSALAYRGGQDYPGDPAPPRVTAAAS
ncbi:hypothetical protein [Pseudonocardia sp. ICBG162]|uniref:hypothetical protein n=1 Tax=Pseudonocardia sp. ICBG162 TaxID=2846761 RepID=UPI001CF67AC0|nr:hypothetical protein [Pseudonocardia sp. ICBG162]